jgi:hypothetical protein
MRREHNGNHGDNESVRPGDARQHGHAGNLQPVVAFRLLSCDSNRFKSARDSFAPKRSLRTSVQDRSLPFLVGYHSAIHLEVLLAEQKPRST